ncbi:hypothetical protein PV08_00139 [Exophiala spinifera]|uniref:Extracellular mutant protein 11 C-terminal domain-containing protein n=1 Tax=Exophiala spinifera TaxID=91928 RepID=A0A0D1YWC2_9EURO|nr:uncharacterized protein PV08_00139 [Exophiala spinifera]KIW19566.1 hypothetical protein PV08_00139 [Exophiala spinifera]
MPLTTLPNRGSTGVSGYLHTSEPGAVPAEARSLTPQPRRERSKQRANGAATRGARSNSSDANITYTSKPRRQNPNLAQRMKIPVPDTLARAKARTTQSVHHDNVTTMAQSHAPTEEVNAFDDTRSIHFDDSTSLADGSETQRNVTFGLEPEHEPPSFNLFKTGKSQFKAQRFTQPQVLPFAFAPEWKKQDDHQRLRLGGGLPKYGHTFDREAEANVTPSEAYDDGYEPDGEYADNNPADTWDTPSRARMPPENEFIKPEQHQDAGERSDSPGLHHRRGDQQPHKSRFQVHKQTVVDNVPKSAATIEQPAPHELGPLRQDPQQPPPFSSKISSYHESSSEEEITQPVADASPALPLPDTKRPRTEYLDFSLADIVGKTMADMDAIAFTIDPSSPPAEPALDAHGTPMSLAARLANLTKMRAEDQKHLFRSLTDAEREQAAAWFLEKFHADVERLMDVRFERRKTALKYELEVKKRDAKVEAKKKDVDEELASLRKGGGQLIAGKSAAVGK